MDRKPATLATLAAHQALRAQLPPEDDRDFTDAQRGLIAPLDTAPIMGAGPRPVWDFARLTAGQGRDAPCPPTVNPSLWRQAQLNAIGGLFEVCPGIHQVRGLDLSNITFIEGQTGRIVVDTLISRECAEAAIALINLHCGVRPISALIYTHSHVDHFGGSEAVRDHAIADMPIIAPAEFLHYAVSENILAGNAMRRRAAYMYGALLPADAQGSIDAGLGKATSGGRVGLLVPNRIIAQDGETATIDGVDFIFQLAPETEAPAEMMFFLPQFRALAIADNACAGLHNLYTLRGAEVRDARAWSHALDQALRRFGAETEVLFGGHHWPRFGTAAVRHYLTGQRDIYKYIHDQTLRLANQGYTPTEIAEALRLPPSLAREWSLRDYYGTVAHNAKAVYQRYLGWFDGHPAHLHPLPPAEAGRRYVDFIGGADALMAKATAAYEAGDYRFVAEVLTHLVFADPNHHAARHLQADALEQLGYQAESAPWRNFYLTGAQELRTIQKPAMGRAAAPGAMAAMLPVAAIFDTLAVSLNGPRADGLTLDVLWHFTDVSETHSMQLTNSVLHHQQWTEEGAKPKAQASLTLTRAVLLALFAGAADLPGLIQSGALQISGDIPALRQFFTLFDRPDAQFGIVLP